MTFEKRLKKWPKSSKKWKGVNLNFFSRLLKNTSNINANHFRVFLNAFGVFLNDFLPKIYLTLNVNENNESKEVMRNTDAKYTTIIVTMFTT